VSASELPVNQLDAIGAFAAGMALGAFIVIRVLGKVVEMFRPDSKDDGGMPPDS
jgi:hypothetical protein